MEAGLLNKKVAFIIQARMKSTRLPGKILLPIPLGNGKPLISWIIDELKNSRYRSKIIIATSCNLENDVLASFCILNNIDYFRGEEENVLSRFVAIAKQDKYDCIVRLTADNPIIDIAILDETIAMHFTDKNDYTRTEGLPVGMNFEVISPETLLDIENHPISDADKEHVTLFVKNSGRYKTGIFSPLINPKLKELRLTIDYASDYSLLATILTLFNTTNDLKGIKIIEKIFKKYPWIFETNAANIQKKQFANFDDEIEEAIVFLKQFDFKYTVEVLKRFAK